MVAASADNFEIADSDEAPMSKFCNWRSNTREQTLRKTSDWDLCLLSMVTRLFDEVQLK